MIQVWSSGVPMSDALSSPVRTWASTMALSQPGWQKYRYALSGSIRAIKPFRMCSGNPSRCLVGCWTTR